MRRQIGLKCLTVWFLTLGGNAMAETPPANFLECAAHFQARASWLDKTGGHRATVEMMTTRANRLAERAHDASINADWEMVVGVHNSHNPNYERDVRKHSLELITEFSELGYYGRDLPLCMEDSNCVRCTNLFEALQ